ncbi:WD40 repeat domain-containing serine/threonine protein kinase [Saccharopolyspora sp. NPDC050389]|uniref:WD40 repeat domain-containing serine/threonine protein kinase n=1 Tax=Saccharopolyspora sp. NPDC050389 TaxID=3155516 RepID=UPI003406599D
MGVEVAVRTLGNAGPREVGPYRVLAELGRGGMGRVLLGSGPDGRLVAVKLVHEQLTEDDGFRARFRREVEASRAVSGAYTAAVVDADPDAPTPWLASVFVSGPTLHDTLSSVGALPEAAVLRLAAGLATALTHIHRAGLVHRDLKPSNVLVTDDGPRVIDFGIVRAVSEGRHDELTRTGWLVGSPAFMSPEQAEGVTVTSAADVFSLASVVVAAATGASPFAGAATLQTLNNVVRLDPDFADVPDAVRRFAEPCLAKDPAARPTAAELLSAIGQLAPSAQPWPEPVHRLIVRRQAEIAEFLEPGQDATVIVEGRAPTSTIVDRPAAVPATLVARRGSSRRWLRIVALVVVVAVAGVVSWVSWPSESATEPSTESESSTEPPMDAPAESSPAVPPFEQVGEITGTSEVEGLAFNPDGTVLTARFDDETAQSWHVESQEQVGQIIGTFDGIGSPVFSADGRTLTTTRVKDETAVVVEQWDLASGRQRGRPFVAAMGDNDFGDPIFSPDGRIMAVTVGQVASRTVRVWDVAGGRPIDGLGTNGEAIGFSADGRTLVVVGPTGNRNYLSMWDVAGQRRLGDPIALPEGEYAYGFTLSTNGDVLTTVDSGGIMRWWDIVSHNQTRRPVTFDSEHISTIAFSPEGAHFATTNANTLMVWELDTGKQIGTTMHGVSAVAFGPDGMLATGDPHGTIRLWQLPGR